MEFSQVVFISRLSFSNLLLATPFPTHMNRGIGQAEMPMQKPPRLMQALLEPIRAR